MTTDSRPSESRPPRRFRLGSLIPTGASRAPIRETLPRSKAQWVTTVLLWGVLAGVAFNWLQVNWQNLFDVDLHSDDVRSCTFALQRYGSERLLEHDPVATELIAFTSPPLRLLYRGLLQFCDIYLATKLVQLLCFLLFLIPCWALLRARRAGLAAAALMAFLILHTTNIYQGPFGGLTRSFVEPMMMTWVAGALVRSERLRFFALLVAAMTHPSSMALLVGAEGLFLAAPALLRLKRAFAWQRVVRYGMVVVACAAISLPFARDQKELFGPTISLEQAKRELVLGPKGRTDQVPLPDESKELAVGSFLRPFVGHRGVEGFFPDLMEEYRRKGDTGPVLLLGILLVLILARISPAPRATLALVTASLLAYAVAKQFAFVLYIPSRYIRYAMPAASILVVISSLGLLAPRLARPKRAIVRNVGALVFIALLWCLSGDGLPREHHPLKLNRNKRAELYDYVRTLPKDVRFACHPKDGDDIPWWTGRATIAGYESVLPWWIDHWDRGKIRIYDTLQALYSTDRQEVLEYFDKYGITHLLLRKDRYLEHHKGVKDRWKKKALLYEPFDRDIRKYLKKRRYEDLVFHRVDTKWTHEEAIIYRGRSFTIMDVSLLRELWGKSEPKK